MLRRKKEKLDYILTDFPEGRTIVCYQAWNEQITEIALEHNVSCIFFHPITVSIEDVDMGFLAHFPKLRRLNLATYHKEPIKNFEQIYGLTELEVIDLQTRWNSKLEFFRFPKLRDLAFQWHRDNNLSKTSDITELCLFHFKNDDLREISHLTKLRELKLFSSSVKCLSGIESMQQLDYLRLTVCSKLDNLDGISNLSSLKSLDIQSCKKISSLRACSSIIELENLYLEDGGDIESLQPLSNLQKLQKLLLIGKVNILDGDFSVLEKLSSLKSVSFVNRAHYSHKSDYFEQKFE